MLDQQDIQKMRSVMTQVIKKEVPPIVEGVVEQKMGEILEDNLMPAMDALADEIKGIKVELSQVKRKLTTVPTRDEVARMINNAHGEVIIKLRTEDTKVNAHIDYSKENGALKDVQYKKLKELKVFPTAKELR